MNERNKTKNTKVENGLLKLLLKLCIDKRRIKHTRHRLEKARARTAKKRASSMPMEYAIFGVDIDIIYTVHENGSIAIW